MENYNAVMESGTTDLNELESAAERAGHAAENLAIANENAGTASETLAQLNEMALNITDSLAQSNENLSSAIEQSSAAEEKLNSIYNETADTVSKLYNSEQISAETKTELANASGKAAEAMEELERAQQKSEAAMENYNAVIASGTADLSKLSEATEQAGKAADDLARANEKATGAADELAQATANASSEAENSEQKSTDAINSIAGALAAAGITATVEKIAESAYELADAFSEAEKVVVNATGATGESLEGLEASMMSAYSGHHAGLDDTAGAIGEINTRMALTGDELTEVTGLFLDYADITGSNVVGSVQSATKVMNQWGVDMNNVESVLDKLAYAGQISGASVDSLSSTLITGAASFQEIGLTLDSAIQLLADFELAGISGTTAITAMRTAVNNFTSDGLEADSALQTVITEITGMEDSTEATALAVETFGSKAGQQLAAAIRSGTVSIDSFSATLEEAEGTLKKTAEAGETLGEKWEKSNNKIKTAFTTALQPTLDELSSGVADLTGKVGDYLIQHPTVTKAITAIGTGLGVVAVGIAAVSFASKVAIPAITTLGVTFNTALGPIGWIALGISAVTAGISAFCAMTDSAEKEVEDYNGTLAECADEISRTEAAYAKACERYGENSEAAKDLESQLETLNAQYEKGGGYLGEMTEEAQAAGEAIEQLNHNVQDQYAELDTMQTSGFQAVAMLEALSEKSELTNSDLDLMQSYADYLNDTFNCNIEVDYDTGKLTGFDPNILSDQLMQQYENQKIQISMDYVSSPEFVDGYTEVYDRLIEAQENYHNTIIRKEHEANALYEDYLDKKGTALEDSAYAAYETVLDEIDASKQAMDSIQDEFDKVDERLKYHCSVIGDETGELYETITDSLKKATGSTIEFNGSLNDADDAEIQYRSCCRNQRVC